MRANIVRLLGSFLWVGCGGVEVAAADADSGGDDSSGGDPTDTESQQEVPDVPDRAGRSQPMSCEWMDGDNCWSQVYRAADGCAPKAVGTMNADRSACMFPSGARVTFEAEIGTSGTFFVDHRLTDPNGDVCFSSDTLGWAQGAFTSPGGTAVIAGAGAAIELTCPDGTWFDSGKNGTCDAFPSRYWAHQVPNYTFECSVDRRVCEGIFWGALAGQPKVLFTCE